MISIHYLCPILTKSGMIWQILVQVPVSKFHEIPIIGFSKYFMNTEKQKEGRVDWAILLGAAQDFDRS